MRISKGSRDRTESFLQKAERLLRWCASTQNELIEYGKHGDLDNFERSLFGLLSIISSAHEAIASAATVAGAEEWLKVFEGRREKDRLLRYLWKARDADIHDAIVKWTPDYRHLQIRVVDAERTNALSLRIARGKSDGEGVQKLFDFLYGVTNVQGIASMLQRGIRPRPERLAEAGVELDFMLHGFVLRQFAVKVKGKMVTIHEPNEHLGRVLSLGANVATETAAKYYEACLSEFRTLLANSAALYLPEGSKKNEA